MVPPMASPPTPCLSAPRHAPRPGRRPIGGGAFLFVIYVFMPLGVRTACPDSRGAASPPVPAHPQDIKLNLNITKEDGVPRGGPGEEGDDEDPNGINGVPAPMALGPA